MTKYVREGGSGRIPRSVTILIALLFGAMLSSAGQTAGAEQKLNVRYAEQSGFSDWYTVNAQVRLGNELNNATGSSSFDMLTYYAVIFWDPERVTVIELAGSVFCTGGGSTQSCVIIGRKGVDLEGQQWEVCTGEKLLCGN